MHQIGKFQLRKVLGKAAGGSYEIMGLAAVFAWLTVKRSNEVRNFTRKQVLPEGEWHLL